MGSRRTCPRTGKACVPPRPFRQSAIRPPNSSKEAVWVSIAIWRSVFPGNAVRTRGVQTSDRQDSNEAAGEEAPEWSEPSDRRVRKMVGMDYGAGGAALRLSKIPYPKYAAGLRGTGP